MAEEADQNHGHQQHLHVEGPACGRACLPMTSRKVVFAARHQIRLLTGRFMSPKKKAEFMSGVESVRRCTITFSSSPAQWPDYCRLVVHLCQALQHLQVSWEGPPDKMDSDPARRPQDNTADPGQWSSDDQYLPAAGAGGGGGEPGAAVYPSCSIWRP